MELFIRDNHSPDSIEITLSEKHISQVISDLLKKYYPNLFLYNESITIETIGGPNLNSLNYRVGGSFYLKFLPRSKNGINPEIYPQISNQLTKCGFNSAEYYPVELNNKMAYGIYSGDSIINESYFFLQNFISSTFFKGNLEEVEQITSMVSRLESVFSKEAGWTMDGIFNQNSPFNEINLIEDWKSMQVTLSKNSIEYDQCIRDTYSVFPQLIDDYFSKYSSKLQNLSAKLDFGVFHSDLHPHNILSDTKGKLWIIDYESFRYMPKVIYRGFSLFKILRKSIATDRCSLSEIQRLLNNNFNKEELSDLDFGAQTELIRRILLILNLHFNQGDSRWNFDLIKHTSGLKESAQIFYT
jgi:hypothetical protein